ncbi:MAG: hypothetical protein RR490_00310, partial [Niameybacter sp.]
MSKKMKKAVAIGCAMAIGTGAFSVSAANLTKNVKAVYNNIKVTYDGGFQTPQYEPFMIDGTVYVSLRDAGQMTNNNVGWDGTNKTVQISSKTPPSTVTDQELASKNLEIATLKNQLAAAEKKLAGYEQKEEDKKEEESKKPDLTTKGLEKLEAILENDYTEKYGVYWLFDLEYNDREEELELTVSFDTKADSTAFDKIKSDKLETLLNSMCDTVQKELGTKVAIDGTLYNDYTEDTIGRFTCSTKGRFAYTKQLTQDDLDDAADSLMDDSDYDTLPDFEYETLKDLVIKVDEIEVENDGDDFETLSFKLYTNLTNDNKSDWADFVKDAGRDDLRALK